ncbi:hypothetical protein AS149_36885 [Burkholderia cenocepacia]|nr:hypothetical protein AS149_36885 [Burkholderia cenocepacia]
MLRAIRIVQRGSILAGKLTTIVERVVRDRTTQIAVEKVHRMSPIRLKFFGLFVQRLYVDIVGDTKPLCNNSFN